MVPGKQFSQLTHKESQIMMIGFFFYRATVPFAWRSRQKEADHEMIFMIAELDIFAVVSRV
jgi:hypothetical protein